MTETNIAIVNEEYLKGKIYIIRGQKVMLDSDLAKIYGYSTKDFNKQVKNNIEKFDDDFMFRINNEETNYIMRCKNGTGSHISTFCRRNKSTFKVTKCDLEQKQ